jgi:hypothetical protein
MITDEFLVEKLRSIFDNECFNLFNYKIPKTVNRTTTGNYSWNIDIEDFRNKQLEQRFKYPTTDNFKFALEKNEFLKNIGFIEEFPLVISNKEHWWQLNNNLSTSNKCCLFFDFYYPQFNLIVELDGQAFHSNKKDPMLRIKQENEDLARDLYCKSELGATIIRLKSFGKYNERKNNTEIKLLENTIKNLQNNNNYYTYNYDNYLLNNWKNSYSNELSFITWVEENYSKEIYSKKHNITVCCDYNVLLDDLNFRNNIDQLFKTLFNKYITIQVW